MLTINAYTTYADVFTPQITSVTHPMTLIVPNLLACRFILELRLETNPTETQLSAMLSAVVREGFEVSIGQEGDIDVGKT
ncbi:hypothetical protein APHAL10511_008146 [Amanita phalloides]|nr:hypothetical protein APHAL10511_008146 [Amanita phalloides]